MKRRTVLARAVRYRRFRTSVATAIGGATTNVGSSTNGSGSTKATGTAQNGGSPGVSGGASSVSAGASSKGGMPSGGGSQASGSTGKAALGGTTTGGVGSNSTGGISTGGKAAPNVTIYMRGGQYDYASTITLSVSGTEGAPMSVARPEGCPTIRRRARSVRSPPRRSPLPEALSRSVRSLPRAPLASVSRLLSCAATLRRPWGIGRPKSRPSPSSWCDPWIHHRKRSFHLDDYS